MADEGQITLKVKSTKQEAQVEFTISTSITIKELKDMIAVSTLAVPAESQRLIWQGKVLKDGDAISASNIKDGSCLLLSSIGGAVSSPSVPAPSPLQPSLQPTAASMANPPPVPPPVPPQAGPVPAHLVVLRAAIHGIRSNGHNSPEVAATALRTLATIVGNILGNPHEAKYRSLKKANATFQKKAGGVPGVPACLNAMGFTEGAETWDLQATEAAWNVLLSAKMELDSVVASLAPPPPSPVGMGMGGMPAMPNMFGQGGMPSAMGAGGLGSLPPDQLAMATQMLQNPAMMQQAVAMMRQSDPAMAQQLEGMMRNPQAMQQMAQMMRDPQMLQQLQNPQVQQQAMSYMRGQQASGAQAPAYPNLIPPQYAQQAQGLQQPGVAPQQASELQGELSEDEALAQAIARSLQDL